MNGRSTETLPAFLQHETADVAGIVLGPDHEDIGDRAVGDPHLVAGQAIAAVDFLRPGDHRARIGTMIRLGQAEATDPFATGKLGQVLLLGCFRAELVDRHHDQGRLHTHHRAVARIDALHFTGDQAVANVVQAAATVLLRDGRAEQADFAHFAEDRRIGLLMTEGFQHARGQLVLGELIRAVTHHALFFSELLVEQQWVDPVEACFTGHERILEKWDQSCCALILGLISRRDKRGMRIVL
ncbi:hypothetical protein D3C81_951850 [compost metagenome]